MNVPEAPPGAAELAEVSLDGQPRVRPTFHSPTDIPARLARFCDETLADQPTVATSFGITEYDSFLPDLTETAILERDRHHREWLSVLTAPSQDSLSGEDATDCELAVMQLRRWRVLHEWGEWRRSPELYLEPALFGVHSLLLHRLGSEEDRANALVARLRGIPQLLSTGRQNLTAELVAPVMASRALDLANAAFRYFRDIAPTQIVEETARRRVAEAGAEAAAAVGEFIEYLMNLAEVAHGDWAIGDARYSALLREAEGITGEAAELLHRGHAALRDASSLLEDRCGEGTNFDDWRAAFAELDEDHPVTSDELLSAYRLATLEARAFCAEHRLVSLAGVEDCLVEPAAPFLRDVVPVAHYIPPPPFARKARGHLFVPCPPEGAPDDVVRERMMLNNHATIPSIAVHEAYPGHHWHLSVAFQSQASQARKMFQSSFCGEGWAVYAEEMMRQQGYFKGRAALASLRGRLFRAARLVVDVSLHCHEMTKEEAVQYLVSMVGISRDVASTEVARYCAWPTQAASYLAGALEIEAMRDRFVPSHASLRAFHDGFARTGCLPLRLAERALLRSAASGGWR